jgi:hypothetical protein
MRSVNRLGTLSTLGGSKGIAFAADDEGRRMKRASAVSSEQQARDVSQYELAVQLASAQDSRRLRGDGGVAAAGVRRPDPRVAGVTGEQPSGDAGPAPQYPLTHPRNLEEGGHPPAPGVRHEVTDVSPAHLSVLATVDPQGTRLATWWNAADAPSKPPPNWPATCSCAVM